MQLSSWERPHIPWKVNFEVDFLPKIRYVEFPRGIFPPIMSPPEMAKTGPFLRDIRLAAGALKLPWLSRGKFFGPKKTWEWNGLTTMFWHVLRCFCCEVNFRRNVKITGQSCLYRFFSVVWGGLFSFAWQKHVFVWKRLKYSLIDLIGKSSLKPRIVWIFWMLSPGTAFSIDLCS